MNLDTNKPFQLSSTYRLQWEDAQDKFVLLYPEGLVELNQSSAEILQLCNNTNHLADITLLLEKKFETSGLGNDIRDFLNTALDNGWITQNA